MGEAVRMLAAVYTLKAGRFKWSNGEPGYTFDL
jgi:hypothetical protein